MKSPTRFIIEPVGGQYVSTKNVGGQEIIMTTSIEEAKDVNRIGKILEIPLIYEGIAKEGDLCVVHHNVFRTTYDDKGYPKESAFFIEENKFYVTEDLLYMVIRDGVKMPTEDNVFISPIEREDKWEGKVEERHTGIVRYGNKTLEKYGVNEGNKIIFRKFNEYEFNIEGERLYLMRANRIMAILQEN